MDKIEFVELGPLTSGSWIACIEGYVIEVVDLSFFASTGSKKVTLSTTEAERSYLTTKRLSSRVRVTHVNHTWHFTV